MVNFWTVVLYFFILIDFWYSNGFILFLGPVSAIYISILAIYTAEKEFKRWHDYHFGRHPGEMYVILWTMLMVVLLLCEVTHYKEYVLPSEVFSTYIVVLGILAITKKSKSQYVRKKKHT